MPHITVNQIIEGAQCMASGIKDLETMGSALLEEAEFNNQMVENMRKFQDDIESLNQIANQRTNAELVTCLQQQNANDFEILKENRELQICLEDYERALEFMMQKYREHTGSKILGGGGVLNFKEMYNAQLWQIIRAQRDKISEMVAVMQQAAAADDNAVEHEMKIISRLQLENQSLRELMKISEQDRTYIKPISVDRSAQTSELDDTSVESSSSSSTSSSSLLSEASVELGNGFSSPSGSSDCDNDSINLDFSSSDALVKCLLNKLLGSVDDLANTEQPAEHGNSSVVQDQPAEGTADDETDIPEASTSNTVNN